MPPAGFEPTIPANERTQTQTLDRAETGIDPRFHYCHIFQDNWTSSEKQGSIIERSAVLGQTEIRVFVATFLLPLSGINLLILLCSESSCI